MKRENDATNDAIGTNSVSVALAFSTDLHNDATFFRRGFKVQLARWFKEKFKTVTFCACA